MEKDENKQESLPEASPTKSIHPLTDLGNADLFAKLFHGQVHFVPELNKWLVWVDGKWSSSKDKLLGLARKLIDVRRLEANHTGDLVTYYGDLVEKEDVLKWVNKLQSKSRIDAMLQFAMVNAKIRIAQDSLDHEPYLVGVKNGVLDLVQGLVRPGRQEDLITKYIDIDFDPEAHCPQWIKFNLQVSCDRKELADFIQ